MHADRWHRVFREGGATWLAPILLTAWMLTGTFLLFRRHEAFQTATYDQGFYTQVVWNTAHGRWFANSIKPPSYLADHFAPLLALLAPLFWVFPDTRALLLAKVLALGFSIVPAYALLRNRYPLLASGLILSFVLNPLINRTLLDTGDFHDIVLAAPTLTLALYALQRERLWLLCEALALTLLVREEMGIYVAPFGLYLLLFRPQWRRVGMGIVLVAIAWTVLVIKVLVPAAGHGAYTYVAQFATADNTLGSLVAGRLPALADLMGLFFTPEKMGAVWDILAPMALLPLLSNGAQLLWMPGVLFLLAMPHTTTGALGAWYVAPLIPLWWGTASMTLTRLSPRLAKGGLALLMAATLLSAWKQGPLAPANYLDWTRYTLTEHERLGPGFLARIPQEAAVVAQSGLGPHLATREQFRMFPWFDRNQRPQLIVLDKKGKDTYPYSPSDLKNEILQLQLDPSARLIQEQDGYLVFALDQNPLIPDQGPWPWPPFLQLEGYLLAQTDAAKDFKFAPFTPTGGRTLRVELYWTALAKMIGDYKISVVVMAPDGFILAQNDSWPGQDSLRTTAWSPGRTIRDTHYLDFPSYDLPSPLTLAVVVYETYSLRRLPPESGIILTTNLASDQAK